MQVQKCSKKFTELYDWKYTLGSTLITKLAGRTLDKVSEKIWHFTVHHYYKKNLD